ncbi:MAG: hypothetical protein NZ959_02175 [Armatimonadetes bacterium]|nr:hypothetical protein [Armatimonadota bacterium]MDW8120868.1 hypothetical protein [Armatimonadota bacterium]
MSVVFVLTPAVFGGWAAMLAAIGAVCAEMGLRMMTRELMTAEEIAHLNKKKKARSVSLDVPTARALEAALERDQSVSYDLGGVTMTVTRDARGRVRVHLDGEGKSEEELQALGNKIVQRLLQKTAHQRLREELKKRGFTIVNEEVDQNQVIRLRVRRRV